eukprot:m.62801 g.62801  ORF g.62801 m.62801 type:complete len:512 (+) comp17714_c0_seq8:23-1558(+)
MQKGSSSLSLPWSPDPQTVDSRQSSAHYLEERELVFSKNGVCCIQGHVSLRGYLALHCRSGSGVTLSWTPVSVLRGLHTNNPDTDKEILVQLHNISILVHRRYPPEHAMCAGAPDGEGDMEEMVLVGVDGKQYPGFRFPSGGVSAFLEAVGHHFTVEDRGESVTASGARDHTFRLGVLASPRASPIGRANSRSVPVFPTRSPRSFLSRIFGNGSADSPPSIDELNGAAETELDPIVARDVRMQRLESRRRVRILRIALVAWRLDAYRAKKRRADVSVLFHHGDVRFTDCFDDGAGPAVEGHRSASAVMAAPSDVSAAGLTPEVWTEVCDPEDGHIATPIALLRAITGGVHPSLRKDCWKLLLRQYNFKHTRARRVERDAQVHSAYEALKMEWKLGALSDASSDAERLASFLEHCNTIDQDVSRSDFHDDGGDEFASGLRSVLRTYLLKPYLFSLCTVHCTALHCLCSLVFSSLLGWPGYSAIVHTLSFVFFWGAGQVRISQSRPRVLSRNA